MSVKPIVRDTFFLMQKSEPATEADGQVIQNLKDTLAAHRAECVGMAANMIGARKNIIVVAAGSVSMIMVNPVIVRKNGSYEAEEGCLSLSGTKKTVRYRSIEVEYENEQFQKKKQKFSGMTAQIIQHECDHLKGILI